MAIPHPRDGWEAFPKGFPKLLIPFLNTGLSLMKPTVGWDGSVHPCTALAFPGCRFWTWAHSARVFLAKIPLSHLQGEGHLQKSRTCTQWLAEEVFSQFYTSLKYFLRLLGVVILIPSIQSFLGCGSTCSGHSLTVVCYNATTQWMIKSFYFTFFFFSLRIDKTDQRGGLSHISKFSLSCIS